MKYLLTVLLLVITHSVMASGGEMPLQRANVDVGDKASLQNGAKTFMNYCSGCHSAKFMRYKRIGQDLGISDEVLKSNLMFNTQKVGDTIHASMPGHDAEVWFGIQPPDLSVVARSRGADWIYTFLMSFYLDPSKPSGVNNRLFAGTAMPHPLWEIQGWQVPEYKTETDAEGKVHKTIADLKPAFDIGKAEQRDKDAEYRRTVRDLVNFLAYVGEPAQIERHNLGWKVIFFLIFLSIMMYLLKREFWRDVH